MNIEKVNDVFMYLICNENVHTARLLNYFFSRDCNKLSEYSTEKAIEICFSLVAHDVMWEHKNLFTGFTPREVMAFSAMYEEYYRWLFV